MKGPHRQDGPLTPFVDGYEDWLLERGYTPRSVVKALTALGHLGRWMAREGIGVEALDTDAARRFVATQVRARGRLPLASVRPLVEYLRSTGVVSSEAAGPQTAIDVLIDDYREWLLVGRGLAASTVRAREIVARRFLAGHPLAVWDAVETAQITAADVTRFLVGESERVSSRSAGTFASRLRPLLRFLAARGLVDPGLAEAVPRVASWRDAAIPRFPAPAAVDALLGACDRSTVTGVRDYAVLLLLARLGLRAIEVARLELSDVDWRAGEIEVDGKAHERGRLPLPADVGEALVAYLRVRGGTQPRVFATVAAPIRPLEASAIRSLVRHAYQRAGLAPVGAHQLRHALASDMLAAGASLAAVSQVLRHKDLVSTTIYAKVDLARLRTIAAPWPGATR